MVPTQGLQGIAFFEASACLTLLVLFIHLRRDNAGISYRLWLLGWVGLTISSFCELAMFYGQHAGMRVVAFITDRKVCARILERLGLPSRVPPLGKARAPPQLSLSD